MPDEVRRLYQAKTEAEDLEPDAAQVALAGALDALILALDQNSIPKRRGLARIVMGDRLSEPPRGLYIWGPVGRGKTLLMDLFFEAAPTQQKRRVHFHEFMGEVHDRLHAHRKKLKDDEAAGSDPIALVAEELGSDLVLLCFDEFAVRDIADAMILGRLFQRLFARVTIVTTSNTAPDDLYKDGLNRALFLPFIALLKDRMELFRLDAARDYRLDGERRQRRYVTPLGAEADAVLDAHFRHLSGHARGAPAALANKGRRIEVTEAAGGVARFSFDDLCRRPLGAGDYLKIADAFHTVILSGVPVMDASNRNEARRFINLVDTFYDRRVRLIVSAAAEPDQLLRTGRESENVDFARTVSRLTEMRSDAYWDAAAGSRKKETARAWPGPS